MSELTGQTPFIDDGGYGQPDPFVPSWLATIVLGMGTLVSHGFGLSLVPAMLPRIEDSFGSGYGVLGLAIAGGLIAYATGGLTASWLMDTLPTRSVLNGTFATIAAGLVVAAAAGSPGVIAVSVVLLGVAAPISWAATTHAAAEVVDPGSRSLVMAGAAGGVGVGVIFNGVLVQAFTEFGEWRQALLLAALISLLVTVLSLLAFRRPVSRPTSQLLIGDGLARYRMVLVTWPGRVVVASSTVAGVSAFTFVTFLTTTSIEELGVSPFSTAVVLWSVGAIGLVSSLLLGRIADRRPPTLVVASIAGAYALGLGALALLWNFPGLVLAGIGLGLLNYPVWGLVASIAAQRFEPALAVRAVSLGLVGAATLAATANALTGRWIDSTGSLRVPIVVLAAMIGGLALWLNWVYRHHLSDL